MTYISSSKDCENCGSDHKGKPFCTYADGVHCFSCGYHRSYDRSFSIQESRTANIPELTGCKSRSAEFSLNNLIWLNKYYITHDDIRQYNILEAPDGALIFCSLNNNKPCHLQKRHNTAEGRQIKSYGPKTCVISSIEAHSVVLVEDPVSDIRLRRYVDVACLWGTKAPYEFLKSLLSYKQILIWLDNDITKEINSGQEAAKNICKTLENIIRYKRKRFGFGNIETPEVINIVTDQDPKCYSPSELKEILNVYTKQSSNNVNIR